MQYPATRAARVTLEAELHELEKAGKHAAASRLLRRLVAITPQGDSHWRYRLHLAENLAREGRIDAAKRQALIIRQSAPPGLEVIDAGTPRTVKTAADRLLAGPARRSKATPPADLPPCPYTEAWAFRIPSAQTVTVVPAADYRDARTRAAQPLLAVTTQGIWALRHDTGETVWEKAFDGSPALRPIVPILWTGGIAVLGLDDEVVAIDPATGKEAWRTPVQRAADTVADTVLERMTCGHRIWTGEPKLQVLGLDLCGGLIRVQTTASVHLLDPVDGYSCMAVGQRTQRSATFADNGSGHVAAVYGDKPNSVTAWDLVTGRQMPGFHGEVPATLLSPGPEGHQVLIGYPSGEVGLIDLSAGSELWHHKGGPLPGRSHVACRIGADNSAVAVGTFDGRLVALDARSGVPKWSLRVGALPREAALEVARLDADILVRCARQVSRVTADGTVAWRHRFQADDLTTAVHRTRQRLLVTGRCVHQGKAMAFVETLDLATGKSDGRTRLPVGHGRFSLVPGEDGLLVIDLQDARFYRPVKR